MNQQLYGGTGDAEQMMLFRKTNHSQSGFASIEHLDMPSRGDLSKLDMVDKAIQKKSSMENISRAKEQPTGAAGKLLSHKWYNTVQTIDDDDDQPIGAGLPTSTFDRLKLGMKARENANINDNLQTFKSKKSFRNRYLAKHLNQKFAKSAGNTLNQPLKNTSEPDLLLQDFDTSSDDNSP